MTQTSPAIVLDLDLPCDHSAPQKAREAISEIDGIDAVRDHTILIASELVTNVVLHSGCDQSTTLQIEAAIAPEFVRIAVLDPGLTDSTPNVVGPRARGPGGLGLRLVAQLSQRWGVEESSGRRVWATVAL